jgi:signal recognition particle subunit SRP54
MFESIRDALRKIITSGYVDEKTVESLLKDVHQALIAGDVDIGLADELIRKIRERVKKEKSDVLSLREQVVKIVYEELTNLVGKEAHEIKIKEKPFKILLVGLFGCGKTTTAGKIAKYYQKRGYNVCLLCLDTFRPAAYDQLKQLASKLNVAFFGDEKERDPIKIIKKFEKQLNNYEIIIADSAGRDALNQELIDEIKRIKESFSPNENVLVIQADLGQMAKAQASAFDNALKIDSVIITRMDGSAKGGGALSACATTGAKVLFIGTGEHLDDFEQFNPQKFVSRLIGLGDLETLIQKVKESVEIEKAKEIEERVEKGKITLIDLYEQLESINKMGSFSKIMSMIPGIGMLNLPKELMDLQEERMKIYKHIMNSMTKDELENPDIINSSRIKRIADGSGRSEGDVKELLSRYKQMKSLMKGVSAGNLKKMMKQFRIPFK